MEPGGTVRDEPRERLELTTGVWIALGLVVLLGVARAVRVDEQIRTIPPWGDDEPIIVRDVGQPHIFPFLGVEVLPVSGWTYLSITDDALADRPTFVHAASQTIISLRLMQFQQWPPNEMEVTRKEYGDVTIEWILVANRRWGRLTKSSGQSEGHVTLMVMTHLRNAELNAPVSDFCRAIRWIDEAD